MSLVPGINSFVRNTADQPVAASTALVDITGFPFTLQPNKIVLIEAYLPFSTGATGGFKFQLTASQLMQDYSAFWEAIDGTAAAPGSEFSVTLAATGPFANAWAVAGSHTALLKASLKGHATLAATISPQFACNSAANAINILKGAWMKVTQINQ
jgi:hypothetical protein